MRQKKCKKNLNLLIATLVAKTRSIGEMIFHFACASCLLRNAVQFFYKNNCALKKFAIASASSFDFVIITIVSNPAIVATLPESG